MEPLFSLVHKTGQALNEYKGGFLEAASQGLEKYCPLLTFEVYHNSSLIGLASKLNMLATRPPKRGLLPKNVS
jgi:hypothetical protein